MFESLLNRLLFLAEIKWSFVNSYRIALILSKFTLVRFLAKKCTLSAWKSNFEKFNFKKHVCRTTLSLLRNIHVEYSGKFVLIAPLKNRLRDQSRASLDPHELLTYARRQEQTNCRLFLSEFYRFNKNRNFKASAGADKWNDCNYTFPINQIYP